MECVILCGGKGTRMGESSEEIPKPLMKIGDKPIIEKIIDHYAKYGVNEFILCLGHLGDKIRDHFSKNKTKYQIDLVDTGENSSKSERLIQIKDKLGERFFLSYGDDLSDVNIEDLVKFHKSHGKIATVTAVKIANPYGVIKIDSLGMVKQFEEKPLMDNWINGGYFIFEKKIYDFLEKDSDLEKITLKKIAGNNNLAGYKHDGFWKSMNTLKDYLEFNELYGEGKIK